MTFIIVSLLVLLQIAGCICAQGLYHITRKKTLIVLMLLLSAISGLQWFSLFIMPIRESALFYIIRDIGYFGCGFIMYFSMLCVAIYLISKIYSINLRKTLSYGVCGVVILLIVGYINATTPRIKEINIPGNFNAKICFLSDIHVGCLTTKGLLKQIEYKIDQIHPDIVIIGGDILDREGIKRYQQQFIDTFQAITKKYQTFAVIGNHEIYSGLTKCINILKKAGIHVLCDDHITLNDFVIVGRLDMYASRKKLKDIMPHTHKPTIVIDHSPAHCIDSLENNAFLQLSGHTHGGQMFPMNLLTNYMYMSTGVLHHKNNSYLYITPGVGFWGPPFRIGSRSEIVQINIHKN